ncbi:Replication protein O [Escherichia coli]|nr:Replication protein O [Escherichia coli]
MTNTAKILNFGRGNFAGQERNVADLDDGYARLSNMLLEAYSGADLTKRQFKVLLAILRKTYGWNKPMDRITDSQLSEITKLPVKRCNEAKLELVRMNIIKQQGGMFGPNKNISEWCIPQNEGKSPKTRDKTSLKLGDCYPSKQGDTKDTITKEKRKDYSSENSGESSDQPENDLSVVKPDAAIQSGSKWGTAEDLTAAEWMFDMVKTIAPSARKPNFAGWANDIRLMRERDGRNHRDMCVLFRWACQDNFWSGNVLSPAKLRDKWTQLEINRNKQQAGVTVGKPKLTAEDLTAAEWMFDMVKTIAPSARKPNFAGWANDIRLMRERDGRNHRDMCVLFRWACQDNFWSGNVLSPAKLRDKWTQLEINRNKQQAGVTAGKPKLDLTNTDWIYGVDL